MLRCVNGEGDKNQNVETVRGKVKKVGRKYHKRKYAVWNSALCVHEVSKFTIYYRMQILRITTNVVAMVTLYHRSY